MSWPHASFLWSSALIRRRLYFQTSRAVIATAGASDISLEGAAAPAKRGKGARLTEGGRVLRISLYDGALAVEARADGNQERAEGEERYQDQDDERHLQLALRVLSHHTTRQETT